VAEAFQERRQSRPFRILYISLEGFIQRFILRKSGAVDAPKRKARATSAAAATPPAGEKGQPWKCGVTQLDEQNEHLFKAIRQYQVDLKAGGDRATDGVLAFLEVHMEGHLALEEAYLEQVQYPGLVEHRGAHRAFVNQLHAFSDRRATGDPGVSLELPQLLFAWLREHVLREDTAWSEFAKANRRRAARAAALGE